MNLRGSFLAYVVALVSKSLAGQLEMPKNDESLTNLVNASGFAFQIAIENALRSSAKGRWTVLSREHPWHDPKSGTDGFIDIVTSQGAAIWVIECKRTKDAKWIFLVDKEKEGMFDGFRALWVAGKSGNPVVAGWDEFTIRPPTHESTFCAIRGTGEGDRSMLERISAQLIRATDSLANEEVSLLTSRGQDYSGLYIPLIVTNAEINICRVNPEEISLEAGTIDNAIIETVPAIRFRKAFQAFPPPNAKSTNLIDSPLEKERTVMVVNSSHLINIMNQTVMSRRNGFEPWPWESVLAK